MKSCAWPIASCLLLLGCLVPSEPTPCALAGTCQPVPPVPPVPTPCALAGTCQPALEPTTGKSFSLAVHPATAALDSVGKTVYALVYDTDQRVFILRYPTNGDTPIKVQPSIVLQAPTAIAIDSSDTLYIADIGSDNSGVIYRGDVNGSMSVVTTEIGAPGGIAISPDGKDLFISGQDKSGVPAVFQVPAVGGSATVATKGPPLSQPSSLTFSADGILYVIDSTVNGPHEGAVLQLTGSTATVFSKRSLTVGFPAGLAPSGKSGLLVTSNATGAASLFAIAKDGTVTTQALNGDQLSADGDPTTIARAAKAGAWVVVDTATPPQKNVGTVAGSLLLMTP